MKSKIYSAKLFIKTMQQIPESELILNKDGSVYHLNLLPADLAGIVINVGDPDRVSMVSDYFDTIELKKQKIILSSLLACCLSQSIALIRASTCDVRVRT